MKVWNRKYDNDHKELEEKIMVKDQYNRMMMIRVAKKYNLDDQINTRIELEYHSSKNYEVSISDLLN
ncbi:hypothetical protein [Lacrimispora celerecrescens]|uniref:Uncharacterized protein n=1 Tax=[Clostridium] celerecrescens 18A TaxID=1286362 RepID=A0A2M8Z300_9FIRM|nr:hypothetical protein [Lacrimispora celerecrescens]PJJ27824.1 hypothetical protein H171_1304 [[Clostridium] celerecrescens 18A]